MNIESRKQVISIHVGVPSIQRAQLSFPPNNLIAGIFLNRLLELALLRAGIAAKVIGTGPLNDSIIMIPIDDISDVEPALSAIKTELDFFWLLQICQIAVWDHGWRSVYPTEGIEMNWLLDRDRHALYREQITQDLVKWISSSSEAGDQKPPSHER
jgi:hypothetical protein